MSHFNSAREIRQAIDKYSLLSCAVNLLPVEAESLKHIKTILDRDITGDWQRATDFVHDGERWFTVMRFGQITQDDIRGVEQQADEPGHKHDAGKPRWDLLPGDALDGAAAVLSYGAAKYTQRIQNDWIKLLFAPNVTSVKLVTRSGDAVRVTRGTCGGQIQISQNDSDKTDAIGSNGTLIASESFANNAQLIQRLEHAIRRLSVVPFSRATDSPTPLIESYGNKVALSARESTRHAIILIIAITQASSVGYYVAAATTALECLAIALRGWNEHWPTCETHSGELVETGARNWEKGMSRGRLFGALMRHLWAYWGGEDIDQESGLPHIDHATCCMLMLAASVKRNIGTDDRFAS